MKVMLALLLLNSKRKILSGKFAETLKKVGGLSCKLARKFPLCKIFAYRFTNTIKTYKNILCKFANTFPEVGISSSRLAGAFPDVGISSCRLAGAFPEVEITLCRRANIIPEVGLAFRRTGRLILIAKEHANNRTKMENDGKFSFNNDIEYNFLIIQKENVIRGLVLRNRNRQSGFYNNFLINQNF